MKTLEALDRIQFLQESGFQDWRLDDAEPELLAADDWPQYAVALAVVSGQLADSPDDIDALLEAVRHGWSLCGCGVVSQARYEAAVETVSQLLRAWGRNVDSHISTITRSN